MGVSSSDSALEFRRLKPEGEIDGCGSGFA